MLMCNSKKLKRLMKKTIFFLMAIATLTVTSCKDYLDVEPTNAVRTNSFYKTESQVDGALVGVYGSLKALPEYMFTMSEMRSDNVWITADVKQNDHVDICTFNASGLLTDNTIKNAWAAYYATVAAANTLLDKMDDVTFTNEETPVQYEAEVRFIRALAYFDLVRFFGNIPAALHALTTDEAFELGQSTEQENHITSANNLSNNIAEDVEAVKQSLVDLAREAWVDKSARGRGSFKPSQKLRDKVQELFGHDVTEVFITADGIRHLRNHHGEGEEKRGQINFVPDMAGEIYDVVNDFDSASKEHDDNLGNQNVLVVRRGNGDSYALLVERGKKKVEVKTFYKKAETSPMFDAKSPNLNAQSDSAKSPSVVPSIPQEQQKSNEKKAPQQKNATAQEETTQQPSPADKSRKDKGKWHTTLSAGSKGELEKLMREDRPKYEEFFKNFGVSLKAGEKKTVEIAMPRENFEVWDDATNTMRVIAGDYELLVGNSSRSEDLQKLKVRIQ